MTSKKRKKKYNDTYRSKVEYIERDKANRAKYYKDNKAELSENSRKYGLLNKYGLTLEDYNEMFSTQNGECAICRTHQRDLNISLAVDHDHSTGKVRGLLCKNCNLMIGNAKDDISTLLHAIEYLEKS